jgi:hypothetical protein
MKSRVKELVEQGNKLFEKRMPLMNLWQTIAENFYVERADFTKTFNLGDEFASHLVTGVPILARRDLANTLSSMLRPRTKRWFHARTPVEEINRDVAARGWLDNASDILHRIMYDPRARFVRATKEGDNDFAAFGQCVIQVEPNRNLDGLLYRTWHLRDVAFCENSELVVDVVHRKWKIEARELRRLFPRTVSPNVQTLADKEPYKEVNCRHILVPSDQYDYIDPARKRRQAPFVSIYVDVENETVLEETPVLSHPYVIPRWVTVSGGQYAYSPATVVALPDARMLQQIGLTLLEAGQKAVDPPMKAMGEVITGGVNLYAGGVTWVDSDYDERTGTALEPIPIDTRGLNWGVAVQQKIEIMIQEAFFLNKVAMPEAASGDRTAYEMQKRVEEYVRQALPLFEPMETEYNGQICERSFELAMRMGAFGSPLDIPPILGGADVRFLFESPLHSATERAKAETFVAAGQMLAQAMQLQPDVTMDVNIDRAFRDALTGIGTPAEWMVPEDVALERKTQARQQAAQVAAAQGQMAAMSQTAGLVHQAGEASRSAGEGMAAMKQSQAPAE